MMHWILKNLWLLGVSIAIISATSPTFANHHHQHHHDDGGGCGASASGVPEINGSSAATGLALIIGSVLLLLDRSKQPQVNRV